MVACFEQMASAPEPGLGFQQKASPTEKATCFQKKASLMIADGALKVVQRPAAARAAQVALLAAAHVLVGRFQASVVAPFHPKAIVVSASRFLCRCGAATLRLEVLSCFGDLLTADHCFENYLRAVVAACFDKCP
jgi:hypothetical protein